VKLSQYLLLLLLLHLIYSIICNGTANSKSSIIETEFGVFGLMPERHFLKSRRGRKLQFFDRHCKFPTEYSKFQWCS